MGIADLNSHSVKKYLQRNCVDSLRIVDRSMLKKRLFGIGLGQIISLLIAGTGVFSQLLAVKYNVNIPTTQSLLNYILLCFFTIVLLKRGNFWHTLKTQWYIMLPLALVDVEANYIVVKAYQYTTITSIMVLDCFTIPCVVIMSRIFLKTRYTLVHIVAVIISLVGMIMLFISDLRDGEDANGGPNPLVGDIMVLASSFLYAVSNVGQEYTVKKYDRISYLALLGIFGTVISGIQLAILERNELATMNWTPGITGYMIGFALCLFGMYAVTPTMMDIAGATLMNLSLLTSDIFSLIIGIFLFDRKLSWLYLLGFFIILSSLIIYNLSQPHYKDSEVKKLMENKDSELEESKAENGTNTSTIDSNYDQYNSEKSPPTYQESNTDPEFQSIPIDQEQQQQQSLNESTPPTLHQSQTNLISE
eukprot:gene1366-1569_t